MTPHSPRTLIIVVATTVVIGAVAAVTTATPAMGMAYRALLCFLTTAVCSASLLVRSGEPSNENSETAMVKAPSWVPTLLRGWERRTVKICLAIIAVGGLASYSDFGRMHGGGRFIHYHEFYHYSMGSKYFPELGYDGLYAATVQALSEDRPQSLESVAQVKNLTTYQLEALNVTRQRASDVASVFGAERWQEFKTDIRYFDQHMPPHSWRAVLIDHGFNGTPFWIAIGGTLVEWFPLERWITLLASIDIVLLIAAGLLVAWAFGFEAALFFAIFLLTSVFTTFGFTGGAFLRQLWFVGLIGFVCLSQQKRWLLAGVALAIATADRVFPILFALVPAVQWLCAVRETRSWKQPQLRFVAGFVVAALLIVGSCATKTGGVEAWPRFYANISAHSDWFYLNQVSLRSVTVIDPLAAMERADSRWDDSLWIRERQSMASKYAPLLVAFRVLLFLMIAVSVWREPRRGGSWAAAAFLPFVLLYPANYYYGFLVLAVIGWRLKPRIALFMLGWQGVFWLLNIGLPSPQQLEVLNWTISVLLGALLIRHLSQYDRLDRNWYIYGVAVLVCMVSILIPAVTPSATRDNALDLSTNDVATVSSGTANNEAMTEWGTAWSLNDHLVCKAVSNGATLTVRTPVDAPGRYQVRIDYTTAPVFGIVHARIGTYQTEPVNLFSPRLGIRTVVADSVEFGDDAQIQFTVNGKHPASTHYHFAIDRITLTAVAELADISANTVLNGAMTWLWEHPATIFDGGWASLGLEATLVQRFNLLRGDAFLDYADLPTPRGEALTPAAQLGFARLVEATRRLRLDEPQAAWKETLETIVASGAARESLPLFAHLTRLGWSADQMGTPVPGVIDREYRSRELLGALAGQLDPRSDEAVRAALTSIADEVLAVTDYGRVAPPITGAMSNMGFLRPLVDRALSWGIQRRDVAIVSRMFAVAHCVKKPLSPAQIDEAVRFLARQQDRDGSFGAVQARATNPRRDAVLMTVLALSMLD